MNTLCAIYTRGSRVALASLMLASSVVGAMDAGAANAATKSDRLTVVVRYDRKDLDSDYGVRSLYRRLVRASMEVCSGLSDAKLDGPEVSQCRQHAIAEAVAKINDRRLTAIYDVRSGRPKGV